MSTTPLNHSRYYSFTYRQKPLDIGINHPLPVLPGTTLDWLSCSSQSGIVDQKINIVELFSQAVHCLVNLILTLNIKAERTTAPSFSFYFQGQFLKSYCPATGHYDIISHSTQL